MIRIAAGLRQSPCQDRAQNQAPVKGTVQFPILSLIECFLSLYSHPSLAAVLILRQS